jgi:hypothetical protein
MVGAASGLRLILGFKRELITMVWIHKTDQRTRVSRLKVEFKCNGKRSIRIQRMAVCLARYWDIMRSVER